MIQIDDRSINRQKEIIQQTRQPALDNRQTHHLSPPSAHPLHPVNPCPDDSTLEMVLEIKIVSTFKPHVLFLLHDSCLYVLNKCSIYFHFCMWKRANFTKFTSKGLYPLCLGTREEGWPKLTHNLIGPSLILHWYQCDECSMKGCASKGRLSVPFSTCHGQVSSAGLAALCSVEKAQLVQILSLSCLLQSTRYC